VLSLVAKLLLSRPRSAGRICDVSECSSSWESRLPRYMLDKDGIHP
jgi:hypothetical protein